MIQEYPDYFLNFSCIGGACKDSCCIGWEVDIDEESYYYYQTLKGPFGDLIRSRISVSPDGDYYFPMTAGKRCPFLNPDNLCDMILQSGEEALCVTCDEYPRYFNRIGDYEQVDISLSCMEAGRLLFASPDPITYQKSVLAGYDDDPIGDDALCDGALRQELIRERDRMIELLQKRNHPVNRRIRDIILQGAEPESIDRLLERFRVQEAIDKSWRALFKDLSRQTDLLSSLETECFLANRGNLELWFEKLAVYFTYRYHLDAYYDGDPSGSLLLTARSLQMIWLMLIYRWYNSGKAALSVCDIIDISHIYSRQTEHCEENIDQLKNP